MGLVVYNTLTRSKEEFKPIDDNKVKMFVCGQTVYDDAHLGHAKTYINFDIIVRWLKHLKYDLVYVQNITDVEDKIIARAKERKMDPFELAKEYEKRFLEDMEAVGVKDRVDKYPRSSEYIDVIRDQIQNLADKGFAYYLDGDVYYDVAKFKDYTKLSGMKIDELTKHRVEPKEGKRNVYDFSLWKASKPGEPSWNIELSFNGEKTSLSGRPGWHIEDTAITYKIFGPQYDLHGGASELIFPHHTNEIAQTEAAYGVKPFVKYWLHSGVLNIKGEKMSKSLRNFVTVRETLKEYDAEVIRLLFSSTHYRKEINYTKELVDKAKKRLSYLYSSFSLFYNMHEEESSEEDETVNEIALKLKEEFADAMNDDFNTALALSQLTIAINNLRSFAESNKSVGSQIKKQAVNLVLKFSNIFGIFTHDYYKQQIPEEAYKMIKSREQLRKEKRFAEADKIRMELKEKYRIAIDDTEYGTVWYSINY